MIEHLCNPVHYPISTRLIGKEVVHRSSATACFPLSLPQDIGGTDGLPDLWVKAIVMQAVKEIRSHAPNSVVLLDHPSCLPYLEPPDGLLPTFSCEDELCLLGAMRHVAPADLHCSVAQFMSDAPLSLDDQLMRVA